MGWTYAFAAVVEQRSNSPVSGAMAEERLTQRSGKRFRMAASAAISFAGLEGECRKLTASD